MNKDKQMPIDSPSEKTLASLLNALCGEGVAEEIDPKQPLSFFTRADEGKTIDEGARTIFLNQRGRQLLSEIVGELRQYKKWQVLLSEEELQEEVVTSLFQGTQALEERTFDVVLLEGSLLARLAKGSAAWEVYVPIAGLELPGVSKLSLAGGVLGVLSTEETSDLINEYKSSLKKSKWLSPEKMESGIAALGQRLDEAIGSSKYWYHIQVEGRTQAAKNQAIEAASLAVDILCFFASFNGMDPELSALGFPSQTTTEPMRYFQFAKEQGWNIGGERGARFPYKLDMHRYTRLTELPEFQKVQLMSNKRDPDGAERKFLLGVQQYVEASRLPTPSLKLVWYLSALETVLAKESEGDRDKKVERRVKRLLGVSAAKRINPLYNKRRKPVHYGHRNRTGDELVTDVDGQDVRILALLGIVSALHLHELGSFTDHDAFLDHVDSLSGSST